MHVFIIMKLPGVILLARAGQNYTLEPVSSIHINTRERGGGCECVCVSEREREKEKE